MASMFDIFGEKHLRTLPNVRTLSLREVEGGVDLYYLVDFLYLRSDTLRSFRLVWASNPSLNGEYPAGPRATKTVDTISGHLSRLAQSVMEMYLGTEGKNYVAIADSGTVAGQDLMAIDDHATT